MNLLSGFNTAPKPEQGVSAAHEVRKTEREFGVINAITSARAILEARITVQGPYPMSIANAVELETHPSANAPATEPDLLDMHMRDEGFGTNAYLDDIRSDNIDRGDQQYPQAA